MPHDVVEHEADGAAEERVAPHQEDELQVPQADAEGGDPLEHFQVRLDEEAGEGQDQDHQLQHVFQFLGVLAPAQGVELEELLDEEQSDGD